MIIKTTRNRLTSSGKIIQSILNYKLGPVTILKLPKERKKE